jgi:hypothetical protein
VYRLKYLTQVRFCAYIERGYPKLGLVSVRFVEAVCESKCLELKSSSITSYNVAAVKTRQDEARFLISVNPNEWYTKLIQ